VTAIFTDEIAAHASARRERFVVRGPQVFLHPRAFSTLALVIHELVTNSAKYGSLSGDGAVTVTVSRIPGEDLRMATAPALQV
jgi:two-component sensor histidine kinase